jgi:hypothetical protein
MEFPFTVVGSIIGIAILLTPPIINQRERLKPEEV